MLKVTDLKVKYGMIEAIKGISFEVRDGEIVTMIGEASLLRYATARS